MDSSESSLRVQRQAADVALDRINAGGQPELMDAVATAASGTGSTSVAGSTAGGGLVLLGIKSAEHQVVAGMKYTLVLSVEYSLTGGDTNSTTGNSSTTTGDDIHHTMDIKVQVLALPWPAQQPSTWMLLTAALLLSVP